MTHTTHIDPMVRKRVKRNRILGSETIGAVLLIIATVVAMVWANLGDTYDHFWEIEAFIGIGDFGIKMPLNEWVDEGLMTMFFFMVGLDVRHEVSLGELSQKGRTLLPLTAAIGGLVVPAAVYFLIAGGSDPAAWGTTISTDTAFALGMLALIGPRNAPRLRIFLLAFAVIDDIGALSAIAIFYSGDIDFVALGIVGVCLAIVWVMQHYGVWRATPYAIVGVITWVAMLQSGVHATLAGVLLGILMPVAVTQRSHIEVAESAFHLFRQAPTPRTAMLVNDTIVYAIPFNQRLTAILPPYVNFIIVPLFALANAGVRVDAESLQAAFASNLFWGIVAGLVIGKTVGITVAATAVQRFVPAARLPGLDAWRIAGVAALAGIGFTISLLVAGLAIDDPEKEAIGRLGVLTASLISLLLAWAIFAIGDRVKPLDEPAGERLQREVNPERDHIRGDVNAPVTLVVYTELNQNYRDTLAQVIYESVQVLNSEGHEGTVRLVLRHRTTSDQTTEAAMALEAADAQGRFWDMHDALVQSKTDITEDEAIRIAGEIGLDVERFTKRLVREGDRQHVEDDNYDVEDVEDDADLETDDASDDFEPIMYLQGKRLPGPLNRWQLTEAMRAAIEEYEQGETASAEPAKSN